VTILRTPKDAGRRKYPSLGWGVKDYIEKNLVFGPGSLQGQPAVLDSEKTMLLVAAYEIYPQFIADSKTEAHPMAGLRRFNRVAWELRKGRAPAANCPRTRRYDSKAGMSTATPSVGP
jgi:hypothetical protein